MGGKLGKKGLPAAEENLEDPKAEESCTETAEPSGGSDVSTSDEQALQEEREVNNTQISPGGSLPEQGDAAPITEDLKSAHSSIDVDSRTDQLVETSSGCADPTDPCSEIETVVAAVVAASEESGKEGIIMTPPPSPSED